MYLKQLDWETFSNYEWCSIIAVYKLIAFFGWAHDQDLIFSIYIKTFHSFERENKILAVCNTRIVPLSHAALIVSIKPRPVYSNSAVRIPKVNPTWDIVYPFVMFFITDALVSLISVCSIISFQRHILYLLCRSTSSSLRNCWKETVA